MIASPQVNALDPNALADLKRQAKDGSPAANKAVAQQFEAVFMQMMLKSMRDTLQGDNLTSGEDARFYQGLADQQMSMVMAQRGGIGLASALERLMNGTSTARPASYDFPAKTSAAPTTLPSAAGTVGVAQSSSAAASRASAGVSNSAQAFVAQTWSQAQEAASSLGVPAHFLVAQAALETGWGKSELHFADGRPSYNLFNIKAGRDWKGSVVEAQTTEYENGHAVTKTAKFRAYGSYAEAFADYANLIGQSPRYAEVLGKTDASGFAQALQKAGYATDPAYASKLARVINGNTMRQGMLASVSL